MDSNAVRGRNILTGSKRPRVRGEVRLGGVLSVASVLYTKELPTDCCLKLCPLHSSPQLVLVNLISVCKGVRETQRCIRCPSSKEAWNIIKEHTGITKIQNKDSKDQSCGEPRSTMVRDRIQLWVPWSQVSGRFCAQGGMVHEGQDREACRMGRKIWNLGLRRAKQVHCRGWHCSAASQWRMRSERDKGYMKHGEGIGVGKATTSQISKSVHCGLKRSHFTSSHSALYSALLLVGALWMYMGQNARRQCNSWRMKNKTAPVCLYWLLSNQDNSSV